MSTAVFAAAAAASAASHHRPQPPPFQTVLQAPLKDEQKLVDATLKMLNDYGYNEPEYEERNFYETDKYPSIATALFVAFVAGAIAFFASFVFDFFLYPDTFSIQVPYEGFYYSGVKDIGLMELIFLKNIGLLISSCLIIGVIAAIIEYKTHGLTELNHVWIRHSNKGTYLTIKTSSLAYNYELVDEIEDNFKKLGGKFLQD